MFDRLITFGRNLAGRPPHAEFVAVGRWENEGGANPRPAPSPVIADSVPAEPAAPTAAAAANLDARQDRVMQVISSDGRPPTHPQRTQEWRWLSLGAVLVTVGITVWMLIAGVTLNRVGGALAIGVLLLVGASPVLAAGLLRGKEERAARRIVRLERQQGRNR